jgi:hypothetical protein
MRDLLTCVRSIIYGFGYFDFCYKRGIDCTIQHVNAMQYIKFHLAISVHHGLVFYIFKRYERVISEKERE